MKLNEEMIEAFANEVREGLPVLYTCDLLGIHKTTYEKWMAEGEAKAIVGEEDIYTRFFGAIKKAYAEFVKESRRVIRSGERGWQGSAWWLERTNPTFMPKQQIQADDEGKVQVIIGGKQKDIKIKKASGEGDA